MQRRKIILGGAGVALLAVVVLVGWMALGGQHGSMHDADDHAAMMEGASGADGGMSDAAFVAGMIPHHQGAVDMAQVVLERSTRPELRELARQMIASQTAEIALMEGWRSSGAVGTATGGSMGAMMDDGSMMMGGMSADDLRTAADVDRAFLEAMIPHHQSAVMMAEMVAATTTNPDVERLAREIIAAQEREIAQMRQWRSDWFGQ